MVRGSALPGLYQRNIQPFRPNQFHCPSDPCTFWCAFHLFTIPVSTVTGKHCHNSTLHLPGSGSVLGGTFETAGGAFITLFLLAAAFHFLRNGKPIFSGVLCGLALLSGTGVWSVLLPLAITILIWVIIYRKNWNFAAQSFDQVINTVKERPFGFALILSIVIIGTAWFIFPRSLSALTSSIPDFLRLWKEQGSLPFPLFSLGMVIYFPVGLILGIWGGVRGILEQDRPRIFLFLWTLVGLVLVFASPARDLTQIFWVVVPLYLLAALELSLHFHAEQGDLIPSIGIALLVFIMIAFLWLSFGRITYGGDQKELLIAVGAGIGILLLSGVLIILGWSAKIAGKGILWGMLGVFAIYMFSTAWRVSGISTVGQTEMIGPVRSLTQIALIDKTISELSNWTAESSKGIQVSVIGLNSKSLEWGLKDYPNANFRMEIPGDEHPPIVIAAKDEPFNFQDRYRGQDFVFESSVDWQSFQPMDWISWLVHRKATTINSSIVLWARADLFPGGAVIPLQ